jgi:hypothetical protein
MSEYKGIIKKGEKTESRLKENGMNGLMGQGGCKPVFDFAGWVSFGLEKANPKTKLDAPFIFK